MDYTVRTHGLSQMGSQKRSGSIPMARNILSIGAIIETQNFIVNHEIPPEVFTVDIPDNATIQVEALDEKLSEEEFRQWYDEIHLKGIRLIKDR